MDEYDLLAQNVLNAIYCTPVCVKAMHYGECPYGDMCRYSHSQAHFLAFANKIMARHAEYEILVKSDTHSVEVHPLVVEAPPTEVVISQAQTPISHPAALVSPTIPQTKQLSSFPGTPGEEASSPENSLPIMELNLTNSVFQFQPLMITLCHTHWLAIRSKFSVSCMDAALLANSCLGRLPGVATFS